MMTRGFSSAAIRFVVLTAVLLRPARGSDHADPIDLVGNNRQEPGITDLFVFPVFRDDQPAFPFSRSAGIPLADQLADLQRRTLSDEERQQMDALVVVVCVRRQLTDRGTLNLEPYTYTVHFDFTSEVVVDLPEDDEDETDTRHDDDHEHEPMGSGYSTSPDVRGPRPTIAEAIARYGGFIADPTTIRSDARIEFRLNDDASLNGPPQFRGRAASDWGNNRGIRFASGVYDDPFIFPAFFGTNVVGMAIRIPMELLPTDSDTMLIWATSRKGSRQIDHVGRSLRTQNPRFELLNTLPPSQHVAALQREHENPSLMRDVKLRLGFNSLFAFREWDFVPDVMVLSLKHETGFPNGRLLTDDVAALLAQHGDTLLYELSHHNASWPRAKTNDRAFDERFPYLAEPWPDRPQPSRPGLTTASIFKLIAIGVFLLLVLVLENVLVVYVYWKWKMRRRFL